MKNLKWVAAVAGLSLIAFEGASLAQPGPPGGGPGPRWGQGRRGGGPGWRRGWRKGGRGRGAKLRCAGPLMRAHPDMLKTRLGLNDGQVKRIQTLRVNFWTKRIQLRSQIQQHRLKVRLLMQADLPNQAKVLAAMRKVRGARGKLQEERIKTGLKMLALLSKQQRQLLRTQRGPGQGRRWGRGGGRWGGGRRWGGRGGGGGGW